MKKEKKAFQSEGLGFGAGDNKETKKKKECGEDYRAETDTEPAKRQSVGTKIKNSLMDKRSKGFMVRESSENRKRDKCKPAWVETEFCWSNISFDFLFPFFPAQPGSAGKHANVLPAAEGCGRPGQRAYGPPVNRRTRGHGAQPITCISAGFLLASTKLLLILSSLYQEFNLLQKFSPPTPSAFWA